MSRGFLMSSFACTLSTSMYMSRTKSSDSRSSVSLPMSVISVWSRRPARASQWSTWQRRVDEAFFTSLASSAPMCVNRAGPRYLASTKALSARSTFSRGMVIRSSSARLAYWSQSAGSKCPSLRDFSMVSRNSDSCFCVTAGMGWGGARAAASSKNWSAGWPTGALPDRSKHRRGFSRTSSASARRELGRGLRRLSFSVSSSFASGAAMLMWLARYWASWRKDSAALLSKTLSLMSSVVGAVRERNWLKSSSPWVGVLLPARSAAARRG
mmetsp:Transcript_57586/g.184910  ORF Transcript_57586/g.184910 Transcript_57586/m.184910 type:complete len:269 (+) Transcript_57586:849-1655(+)